MIIRFVPTCVLAWAVIAAGPGPVSADSPSRRARATKNTPRRAVLPSDLRRQSIVTQPTAAELLKEELDDLRASRILRRGLTAIYIVDAKTGTPIYEVNPDNKLNPASNVKLLATATVLDQLGPDWRYITRMYGRAPDGAGVANGDLYLRGNADPTFWHQRLDRLAGNLSRSGVKRIRGDVVLSDDLLRDSLSSSRIKIRVASTRPGEAPQVTVEPPSSFYQIDVRAETTRKRRARLSVTTELIEPAESATETAADASPGSALAPRLRIVVSGKIRDGKSKTYRRTISQRSSYTGYLVRDALERSGITVEGGVRLASFADFSSHAAAAGWLPVELARTRSTTLSDLISRTNKRSINWLADRLLMTAGWERLRGKEPSLAGGLEAMQRWLERAGVSPDDVVVDTGSGLSRNTQLSARQIVRVLRAAAGYVETPGPSHLDSKVFVRSLAVGGVDGTLKGRFRSNGLRGHVRGKTGTLRDSVALSGFLTDENGAVLCFSIVTNGNKWHQRHRIRREHEYMVRAIQTFMHRRKDREVMVAARNAKSDATKAAAAAGGAHLPPSDGNPPGIDTVRSLADTAVGPAASGADQRASGAGQPAWAAEPPRPDQLAPLH